MKVEYQRRLCIASLSLFGCSGCTYDQLIIPVNLVAHVDPFIGTGGDGFGYGGLSPAATAPNGMVKVGPDTSRRGIALGFNHSAGYFAQDSHIDAFSHQRMPGIGVSDGGGIGFMLVGEETIDPKRYRTFFEASDQIATPGYYAVALADRGHVELTATLHAAYHRYAWSTAQHWLTIDLGHTGATDMIVRESWLAVDADNHELSGHAVIAGNLTGRGNRGLPIYFVARFSQPWSEIGLWRDGMRAASGTTREEGMRVAASLRFADDVEVKVGLSWVDVQGARNNLDAEITGWDFAATRRSTEQAWADRLDVLQIEGGTAEQQTIFATALYHALQLPTLATDLDGRYRGLDGQVHQADGFTYYSDFSLWDTYRTLHPLVILLWPDLAADLAASLVAMGEQAGFLPLWPAGTVDSRSMVGDAAGLVLAESYVKGVRDFPVERGFAMAIRQASESMPIGGRSEISEYLEYGYVPADVAGGSVAKTLEYAINDAALAMWADAIGEVEIGANLRARAGNYSHVFDAEAGFMRGRNRDGSWTALNPDSWDGVFAEGNAWQYSWLAPHDAAGLAALFGGADALVAKLTDLFTLSENIPDSFLPDPYYWHGNEPDLHAAFLFAQVGAPALTQRWVDWVRRTKYGAGPDGLDGNDDGGTLSAWYVFAAIGLYPINGTDRYVLSTPLFETTRLRHERGTVTFRAGGSGVYLAGIDRDGRRMESFEISHTDLLETETLELYRVESP